MNADNYIDSYPVTGIEDSILRDVLETMSTTTDSAPDLTFLMEHSDNIVGHIIESVPASIRHDIWQLLPADRYWSVLLTLQQETARHLIKTLDEAEQLTLQQLATGTDLIELADVLPDRMIDAILRDQDDDIQEALSYDEDQIGRYINKNIIRVRPSINSEVILRRIKKKAGDQPVAIFVLDNEGGLLGHIPVYSVFLASEPITAEELCQPVIAFDHQAIMKEAALDGHIDDTATWYPVLRENNVIGAVSVWTMLFELQAQSIVTSVSEAPSGEEDLFTPVRLAAKIRGFWLTINLLTAFLASWVIGWFEITLQQVVALAILMPVVASMGGIAGSQTLAVALRGLALNHLTDANFKLVLIKETKIAIINGLVLGVLIALVVSFWFDSVQLGLIILTAVTINSLAAAVSGTTIPFLLKKVHIDPAVSGAVILTTVTDVVGFFVFLSLASVML
ncbi:MAG: magnesium transporter [Oceanicoccus sp.]|jgi:magnesium transporter